jgi:hypothetical protein
VISPKKAKEENWRGNGWIVLWQTHLELKFADCLHLNNFIKAFPTITHLSFRSCDKTVYILERIIEFESEQEDIVAWPNLQALTIVPFDSEWIQPFCDFIAA